MPIPPRVSAVALRTVDLARATAFYVGLGWELSPASTGAMSLFKTAGSLLLVCTDDLLAQLGGPEVAAALAGEPTGEAACRFMWPATPRSTPRSKQPSGLVRSWSRRSLRPRWAAPTGSLPTPTAMSGRSSTTPSTGSEPTGGPRSPRPAFR